MAAFSNYVENALINLLLRGVSFTALSTTYMSLHTSDPTDAGTSGELVGGTHINYTRVALTSAAWNAPVDGLTSNTVDITFPTAGSNWAPAGTPITHVGIWDNASAGNLLLHTPLAAAKTVNTGDVVRFTAGNLSIQIQ